MTTPTETVAAAALARKQARRECNARFDAFEQAQAEHRAAMALTDGRVSWDDLREFRARQEVTSAAWYATRRAWLMSVVTYCTADADYCGAMFELAKVNIRANDNAETRKAYGKAIRARKAAINREAKAIRAAAR